MANWETKPISNYPTTTLGIIANLTLSDQPMRSPSQYANQLVSLIPILIVWQFFENVSFSITGSFLIVKHARQNHPQSCVNKRLASCEKQTLIMYLRVVWACKCASHLGDGAEELRSCCHTKRFAKAWHICDLRRFSSCEPVARTLRRPACELGGIANCEHGAMRVCSQTPVIFIAAACWLRVSSVHKWVSYCGSECVKYVWLKQGSL